MSTPRFATPAELRMPLLTTFSGTAKRVLFICYCSSELDMRPKCVLLVVAVALSMPVLSLGQAYKLPDDKRPAVKYFADELAKISDLAKKPQRSEDEERLLNNLLNHLDFTTMTQPDVLVRAFSLQNAENSAIQAAALSA